jgi:DNA-binding GntR family transcriptional regulator
MSESELRMVRTKSLSEQVADSIVEGIATGSLEPGQRIGEAALADQLQVSRVPVREALKILETQGIVVSRPHRGVRVVAFDRGKIAQLYEIRLFLEKLAIRDASARPDVMAGLLERLDAVLLLMDECLRRGDFLGVTYADMAFHREICLASGNQVVIILWETLSRHMLIVFEQELKADRDRAHIVEHHRALRFALESRDPVLLAEEIEKHILRIQGISHTSEMVAGPGVSTVQEAS